MKLSEVGERYEIDSEYRVVFPNTNHLVLMAGALYPNNAIHFDHPNIAAKCNDIFETKSTWKSGRKKWFSHAGVAFYFVIPKTNIELIHEKGYSWVPVSINGMKLHLNVSGGTIGGGWTDIVREFSCTSIDLNKKQLKTLAEAALPRDQVAHLIPIHRRNVNQVQLIEMINAFKCRKELKIGDKVTMREDVSFEGNTNKTFIIKQIDNKKKLYLVQVGLTVGRIGWNLIDWSKTILDNNWELDKGVPEFNILKTAA